MKLVDGEDTIAIVIPAGADAEHSDRVAAGRLQQAINARGADWPYRRAVVVSDEAWLTSRLLHQAPTITVGGPGANGVAGRFAPELVTVWTEGDRVVIQVMLDEGPRRAALWGMDRRATAEAVDAFIARGWLDEFLERCWRFKAGSLA
jgi:hypothetical protein